MTIGLPREQATTRHADLDQHPDLSAFGRRIARKSLLAVAGLVSMHDEAWTTDRTYAATRWAELNPHWAEELNVLAEWSRAGRPVPDDAPLRPMLNGVVADVVRSFAAWIGVWPDRETAARATPATVTAGPNAV